MRRSRGFGRVGDEQCAFVLDAERSEEAFCSVCVEGLGEVYSIGWRRVERRMLGVCVDIPYDYTTFLCIRLLPVRRIDQQCQPPQCYDRLRVYRKH